MSDENQSTDSGGGSGNAHGRPRRRRSRSRRGPSNPNNRPPQPFSPAIPSPDVVEYDVSQQMNEPRPSVQAMEEADQFPPAQEPFSQPADSFADYESPFGPSRQEPPIPQDDPFIQSQPQSEPQPESQPEPEQPALEPHYDPFSQADPFAQSDPFLQPQSQFESEPEPESNSEPEFEAKSESELEPQSNSEPLEGEVVEEKSVPAEALSESEPWNEKFEKALNQANLTTRHLKFCCGGLFVAALVILIALFLVPRLLGNGFPFGGDNNSPGPSVPDGSNFEEEPDTDPSDADPSDADPSEPTADRVWVDPSIYAGLVLGHRDIEINGDLGIDPGILVGGSNPEIEIASKFQTFIRQLESLYNIYQIELVPLLNAAQNRTTALDDHLKTFKEYYNLGVQNYESIQSIRANFSGTFDTNTLEKNALEGQFFDAMAVFEGRDAEESLKAFIALSQTQIDLKAKYLAFGKLEEMYKIVLENSLIRIKDIELNREALITGVQVVDVYGSDLNLILKENELEGS